MKDMKGKRKTRFPVSPPTPLSIEKFHLPGGIFVLLGQVGMKGALNEQNINLPHQPTDNTMVTNPIRNMAIAAALCLFTAGTGLAQPDTTTWTYTGSSTGGWLTSGNWSDDVPDETTLALFDTTDTDASQVSFINFDGGTVDVGAIALLPASEINRLVRSNTASQHFGTLAIHGVDYELFPGDPDVTLLLANFNTSGNDLQLWSGTNNTMTIALEATGYVHAEGQVTIGSPIVDGANGSAGIIKTGPGLLRWTFAGGGSTSQSTYSGGFIMEEGIVEWTSSGGGSSSPFGNGGTLTLRGGTLRSTSDTSRSINVAVALDGGAAFGWTTAGNLGGIAVNSRGGSLSTTVLQDSTIFTHAGQTLTWHQTIGGDFGITKDGGGLLSFTSNSQDSDYAGGFTLQEGIVEWSQSGTEGGPNPFGTGTLTLEGGNLRSSSSGSRTLNTSIALNGNVTFGSTNSSFNGNITVRNDNGNLTTTLLQDLTVTVHNQMTWQQAISGAHGLTITGGGVFVLHSDAAAVGSYTGPTTVEEGTFIMNNQLLFSDVEVLDGARLGGFGEFGGDILVREGATLAHGGLTGVGTMTADGGDVTLEEDAFIEFRLDGSTAGDYDRLVFFESLSLDGAELEIVLNFQPAVNNVFVLADNQSFGNITG